MNTKIKPEVSFRHDRQEVVALLSGELTLRHAKELKAIFREIKNENITTLHIENVTTMDLVFVQLLWVYLKHMCSEDKKINITWCLAEADESLLQRTGFSFLLQWHVPTINHLIL